MSLKRTSFKYRNPKNAPDEKETAALQYIEKQIRKRKLPANYIQKIEENGWYRYYEAGLCPGLRNYRKIGVED